MRKLFFLAIICLPLLNPCLEFLRCGSASTIAAERPNVLIAISDDQSYPHASAYGEPVIRTPGFDQVARDGVLFHRAFTPAPGCSPMRAALLTGQHIWQIREAGTHASSFPRDLVCFPDQLQQSGYAIGFTGKPWGPGNFKVSGWERNPAGPAFNSKSNASPPGISATDYAANFEEFLDSCAEDTPFCFWYGGHEPHRVFKAGSGIAAGMDPAAVKVPGFLPDSPTVRSDLLDYFHEIQWFDQHLLKMLEALRQRGRLENTLVIVTSDNGMSFPRAKANLYEYGIHMPLAISWPSRFSGKRDSYELVNLIDLTTTIYDACSVPPPSNKLSGTSLLPLLEETSPENAANDIRDRKAVFSGRERHSSSRFNSLGYPSRCVRSDRFLYIRNFAPERWPAGAPQAYETALFDKQNQLVESTLGREHGAYHDIDGCPTLDWMVEHRNEPDIERLLKLSVGLRPSEEFFDVEKDPACLANLADEAEWLDELVRHRRLLDEELARTGDLRLTDFAASHVWETYPRYSPLRWFPIPAWAEQNPQSIPSQPWLDERRPQQ